jgi:RimJ/RimL family protein N-acetyltransferase
MPHEPRLSLECAALEDIEAALQSSEALGQHLRAAIADDWAGFPEVLPHLRETLRDLPDGNLWGTFLFLLREPRTLLGMGGFKGAPTSAGCVEIGYAIAPAFQNQGFATEAAYALIGRAFAFPQVKTIEAHTRAEQNASARVLQKLGFRQVETIQDLNDGALWRWRLSRHAEP